MFLEHTEISEDGLSQKIWQFSLTEDAYIVLDRYTEMSRPTKRHKLKQAKVYIRLESRQSNMTLQDVILPNRVAGIIQDKIVCALKFTSNYQGTPKPIEG